MAAKAEFNSRRKRWYVVVHHNGRRRKKVAGIRETAQFIAATINQKLTARELGLVVDPGETFQDHAKRWLTETARKKTTQDFYEFNLRLHINPEIGSTPVASITRAVCRDLIYAMRKKGLKAASLAGVNRTLSAVLSHAMEDNLLAANPAFRMGKYLRSGDEQPTEIQPFTRDEVPRLLEAAETSGPRYLHPFLMTAVRTGMRLGELLALQWGDFDLVAGYVDVRRQFSRERFTTPKSGKGRRIDLSPQLVETLERYLVQLKAAALKAGTELAEWVFPSSEGTVLDASELRSKAWRTAQTRAKLRRRRLHDLRHTYASLMLSGGATIPYVSQQMGHSSIRVTVDKYGHLVPGAHRHEVARLDDADFRRAPAAQNGNPAATAEKIRLKKSL